MRTNVFDRLIGTTFMGTWVSSGATPSQITSALIDRTQAVISSVTATSSGGGNYFSLQQLPNTPGPLINEWVAWINSFPYKSRQLVRVNDIQVD